MTEEELFKNAISIESRKALDKEHLDIRYDSTIMRGNRLYDFYVDSENRYWYSTRIRIRNEISSEYEAVFGRKIKPKSVSKTKRFY